MLPIGGAEQDDRGEQRQRRLGERQPDERDAPGRRPSPTVNPAIGSRATTRPPTSRATTDMPARSDRRQRRRALVGAVLDELDELLDAADLGAEHQDVGDRDGDEEAGAHGLVERRAGRRRTRRRRGCTRSPSGSQPSAAGSGRTSHRANGTMPSTQTTPRIGVDVARPCSSISHLATGVSRMPPADSPVDATDSATDRRTWYQRVTTVVTGTSPAPAKPRANTA